MLLKNILNNLKNTKATLTNINNKLNNMYPVGSIYISVSSTNPATYFGGTWTAFATGQTLVGVDTLQAEFNTVQKTGGEKTHKLTSAEMPAHTHTFTGNAHTHSFSATTSSAGAHTHKLYRATNGLDGGSDWNVTGVDGTEQWATTSAGAHTHTASGTTGSATQSGTNASTGGGGNHNNLQPYITVYMWRRTA